MKKLTPLLAAALATFALSAQANVPTQQLTVSSNAITDLEDYTGTLDVSQFNASLGTLVSVQVNLYSDFSGTFSVENLSKTSGTSVAFWASSDVELAAGLPANTISLTSNASQNFNNLSVYDKHNDFAGTSGASAAFGVVPVSTTVSYTDSATLAAFIGNGTLHAGVSGSTDGGTTGGGNINSFIGTNIDTHATVTYTYVSAVPEPASYGMLLAGLGVMGLVLRKRKST